MTSEARNRGRPSESQARLITTSVPLTATENAWSGAATASTVITFPASPAVAAVNLRFAFFEPWIIVRAAGMSMFSRYSVVASTPSRSLSATTTPSPSTSTGSVRNSCVLMSSPLVLPDRVARERVLPAGEILRPAVRHGYVLERQRRFVVAGDRDVLERERPAAHQEQTDVLLAAH